MALLGWYLSPLFQETFYVPIFDNLDSNVVWYKILAESGKIFAPNDAIIPNMMNGLPRSSYPGEFNVILWLYYFFEPKTAFIINEITIHFVAFISMFIFLKKYIIKENTYYKNIPIFIGALYFALIPYWSGAGLSIAILPLVTYSLLNIKNHNSSKWDWILLILLPLYTSFIFLYMFYIILAGIYLIYDTFIYKKLNKHFFYALLLMGSVFLLSEYRLLITMFFDSGFTSHRSEFNIFFQSTILPALRGGHIFFLNGHHQHLIDLQMPMIIPIIIIGMVLSLSKKQFSKNESILIWILIAVSFAIDIWSSLLVQLYSLPILAIFTLIIFLLTNYSRAIPLLMLFQIILSMLIFFTSCQCFEYILDYLPILKMLNITRTAFVQPFIWAILITLSLPIYIKRLQYTFPFILLFVIIQVIISFNANTYSNSPKKGLASFSEYYAPNLFYEIKQTINFEKKHVVSFGLEPAVSLYNNIYTVDGYSTNYPLDYKHDFRKVISTYLSTNTQTFDEWGSKLYLMQIRGTPEIYKLLKGTVFSKTLFSTQALCSLHTDYIVSSYEIDLKNRQDLIYKASFKDKSSLWDIYLYKIACDNDNVASLFIGD